MAKPRDTDDSDLSSKERIIRAATTLFARNGFEGTSTKEICDAAGVNIAAIHYHFGSKEDLLRQIIEDFGGSRLQSVRRTLKSPESRDEFRIRIELFLRETIEQFLKTPEVFRIVQIESELLHERSQRAFETSLLDLFNTLVCFLKYAQKKNIVQKNLNAKICAQFLFNQLRQVTRAEDVNTKYFGMSIKDENFREKWIEQTVAIFLSGTIDQSNSP